MSAMDIVLLHPEVYRDNLADRFYIHKNGCWVWAGSLDKDGYGIYSFSYAPYKITTIRAHRASYSLFNNKLIKNQIHHVCGIKRCINPKHLRDVSAKTNSRYAKGWTRSEGKWYCANGHLIASEADMYVRTYSKTTQCRKCTIERTML